MSVNSLLDEARARQDLPPPTVRRRLRAEAGLSLRGVGRGMDPPVSGQTVAFWESGDRTPRPAHLLQYAQLLSELERMHAAS